MTPQLGNDALHAAAQQALFVSGAAAGIFALGADPSFTVRLTMRAIHHSNAMAFGDKGVGAFIEGVQTSISIAGLQAYDSVRDTGQALGDHVTSAIAEMRAFLGSQVSAGTSTLKSLCQHIAVDTRRWISGVEAEAQDAAQTASTALNVLTKVVETWGVIAGLKEIGSWFKRRRRRDAAEIKPPAQKIEIHVWGGETDPKSLIEKVQGATNGEVEVTEGTPRDEDELSPFLSG